MAHEIQVFVGPVEALALLGQSSEGGRIFAPRHGARIGALPIHIFGEENLPLWYGMGKSVGRTVQFAPSDDAMARRASVGSALVYLETAYRFDMGYEAAVIWIDGERVYGPVTERQEDETDAKPVVTAIDRLGIATGLVDETDHLGLGAIRSNEQFLTKWIEPGVTPEPVLTPGPLPMTRLLSEQSPPDQKLAGIAARGWLVQITSRWPFR